MNAALQVGRTADPAPERMRALRLEDVVEVFIPTDRPFRWTLIDEDTGAIFRFDGDNFSRVTTEELEVSRPARPAGLAPRS